MDGAGAVVEEFAEPLGQDASAADPAPESSGLLASWPHCSQKKSPIPPAQSEQSFPPSGARPGVSRSTPHPVQVP